MIPGASNPLQPHIPASESGERSAVPDQNLSDKGTRDLEGESRKFEDALKEDQAGGHEKRDKPSEGYSSPGGGESSPGDALLQSLFGAPPPRDPQEAIAPSPLNPGQAAPDNQLAELASQVAERVLVSDPSSGANSEVRIMVKESILPNTEIHIVREAGELQVRIVTKSADVLNQLNPLQGALQALLQERLPRETVRVQVDSGEASEEESRRGTRNPRYPWEEEEEKS